MTWCKKSLATLLLAAVLFVIGCVSNRPAPTVSQIARQRQEVETLVEEIDMIMREIEAVQHKASDKKYSTASQTRDLEDVIRVLREAKAELVAKKRRLREDYEIWDKD